MKVEYVGGPLDGDTLTKPIGSLNREVHIPEKGPWPKDKIRRHVYRLDGNEYRHVGVEEVDR